jgi:hypothetical protein
MKLRTTILIVTVACLLLSGVALVRSSADASAILSIGFDLWWHVIAGGGGQATSGSYIVNGSIAQPIVAESSGPGYRLSAGFWPGIMGPPSPTVTATPTGTLLPIATRTATPTATPSATPTGTPPSTLTRTPTATPSPTPTPTATVTPTGTPPPTVTRTPTATPSPTTTGTPQWRLYLPLIMKGL